MNNEILMAWAELEPKEKARYNGYKDFEAKYKLREKNGL